MEERLVKNLKVGDEVTLIEIRNSEITKKVTTKVAKIEKVDEEWSTLTSIYLEEGALITDNLYYKNEKVIINDYAGVYNIIYKGHMPADELPARIEFKQYLEQKMRDNEKHAQHILEGNKNLEEIINLLHV